MGTREDEYDYLFKGNYDLKYIYLDNQLYFSL